LSLMLILAATVLQPEEIDVASLPPSNAHRVFVSDSWVTGNSWVIDGDAARVIGFVHHPPMSNFALDPKGRYFVVAETIWTKGNRGDRQDFLTLYDTVSLDIVAEVPLPSRILVGDKPQALAVSPDGRYAYVYDMAPATGVHIVDLDARKYIALVETPGCGLIFPAGSDRFGTLCGEGAVARVDGRKGWPGEQWRGKAVFDPEGDAIIDQADLDENGRGWMISYTGLIYPIDFASTNPLGAPFSIQEAAGLQRATQRAGDLAWRPGGRQLTALHRATGRLYVLMHRGEVWTHNDPGEELWEVDTRARKVLRRIKLEQGALNVAVSQDDKPLIFLNGDNKVRILDLASGELLREVTGVGTGSLAVAAK
jgi:methylamine dehydrogenase heavy chain